MYLEVDVNFFLFICWVGFLCVGKEWGWVGNTAFVVSSEISKSDLYETFQKKEFDICYHQLPEIRCKPTADAVTHA